MADNSKPLSRRQREHEKQLERDRRYRAKRKKEREQLKVTEKELSDIRRAKRNYNRGEHNPMKTNDRGLADLKRRFRRLWAEQQYSEERAANGTTSFESFRLEALKPKGRFQRLWNELLAAGRNNDKERFHRVITAMGFYRMGDAALNRYWAAFTAVIQIPEKQETTEVGVQLHLPDIESAINAAKDVAEEGLE